MQPEKSTKFTETIFDEEIGQLEHRRVEVEAERQMLLAGQITVTGPDGSSLMKIDLGALSAASTDQKTVERNLRNTLVENPLMPVLDNSFKKTRELREEMLQRGELLNQSGNKGPLVRVVRTNYRLNQIITNKNKTLAKFVNSSWLLLLGLIILLIWCGGPLLYTLTGGSLGGTSVHLTTITSRPNTTVTASPKTNTPTQATDQTSTFNTSGKLEKVNFLPGPVDTQINSQTQSEIQLQEKPTPTATADTGTVTRVGEAPSAAGGFNGPHGAFMAPSRLKITALAIDTPVERAITENTSNNDAAIVSWPRPGEVVQTGAYPGEIGNMLVMGNQKDLGGLRRVQQNDEVVVYDRKGNSFIYRFVAFGANGQTEREVDPTSPEDAWVFNPTEEAILTILITYPQPLPAVDPNQTGNNQVTPRDDYLVQKKLAYRAVLAMYAPAPTVAAGTPVAVPDTAWQTVAAPSPQPTQTTESIVTPIPVTTPPISSAVPTATQTVNQISSTPSPGSVIPGGLPDTGGGSLGTGKDLRPVPTIIRQSKEFPDDQSTGSFSRRSF